MASSSSLGSMAARSTLPAWTLNGTDGEGCNLTAGRLEKIILPVLYATIILVGLPANFMALWVFLRQYRKHGILVYLINLAAADLLSCLSLPFRVALLLGGDGWQESSPICAITMVVINSSFYYTVSCSTMFLAFISVSRYAMIVKPNSRRLNKFYDTGFAQCACALTWTLTIIPILLLNLNYFFREVRLVAGAVCYNIQLQYGKRVSANAFVTVAVIFLVLLAMFAFSYASIATELCGMRRKSSSQRSRLIHVRAQLFIVGAMMGFVICHLPYHVYQIVTGLHRLNSGSCAWLLQTHHIKLITLWLVSLSSCLDPILYFLLSKSFVKRGSNRERSS
ncbi:probable G-protein coupled receptor 82 isoform X1 [Hypanus sabinus]|uniref:probable G-protein coupled receptor 82 isoform X1 n=2 Tax=Hypanus sabinus TaxID=79690 RepID=UPI0028C49D58|nr:probable G-protein coupled receptor 82 isoform X1 [Hypanus sabinus]XP_059849980.1 probable G-protein coupled receptor 82 isoform X1 [Hypanus sabinus]XP_059849982.1 probable G-protein coupled receptor 82 isoform X1 [Hypanus sabinus]XP_059849983.1 probable G-protein coupled receptor 82 isoform X1 [Hypanus sabinus]XP_059849984.1 probable G-protein coupled receptor 82 isoform X1 [Hypanus sabinus]XP_059849985.1 probable G-protein coupled receptor 82 isoform X1 [Hypanus sabinus]XP_059849986.1 pr